MPSVVRRLVLKDLDVSQSFIWGALVSGAVTLAILPWNVVAFFVGSSLFVVVLIVLNCMLTSIVVLGERKDRIAHFVLSLPISTTQYAVSKMVSGLISFGGPWVVLTGGALIFFAATPLPNGFMPLTVAVSAFCLGYYCVLLGVALVTDSPLWITTVIIIGNVGINFVIQLLIRLPSVNLNLQGETAVWSADVVSIIVGEILIGAAALGLSLLFHSRKREFV